MCHTQVLIEIFGIFHFLVGSVQVLMLWHTFYTY